MSYGRQAPSPGRTYEVDPVTAADMAVLMGDRSAGRRHQDPDCSSTAIVHGLYGALMTEGPAKIQDRVPAGPFEGDEHALSFDGYEMGSAANGLRLGYVMTSQMTDFRSELI